MQETRTPCQYVLVVDMMPVPTDGTAIKYGLYGDIEGRGLEFTAYIGGQIDLNSRPMDLIMVEVGWRLEQHPGISMIYLIGDLDPRKMESLCREISRTTKRPTSVLVLEEQTNQ